jgi:3-hydroxyisobutyrate dehydrogenase-like beta-hydroxyacid dehydrogenase
LRVLLAASQVSILIEDEMGTTPISLGFIGLGNMGNPMCKRLLAGGFDLTIWNRTAAKMEPLIAAGAKVAVSPADLMSKADMVGLCLRDTDSVRAVAFGPDGLVNGARGTPGKLVLDFTSMDPEATAVLAEQVRAEAGIGWIDAPISGGVPAAEKGTLIIFAGGKAEEIARAKIFLEAISRRVTHMGPSGAGQSTKLCNQLIVGVNFLAIAEAFALARRSGIDVGRLTQALEGGFADSSPLQLFGMRMANHIFEPKRGGIDVMLKDLDTVQKIAQKVGAGTPLSSLAAALYRSLGTRPDGDLTEDISALIKLYEPSLSALDS